MKKVLVLLLLIISTSVLADVYRYVDNKGRIFYSEERKSKEYILIIKSIPWTAVSTASTDDMTTYVDYGTIKRKGNKVKMWALYDFKTIQRWGNSSFLSQINHIEYDCEEEATRTLDYFLYLGNKGSGEVVYSRTNKKYEAVSIIPGTIDEIVFNIACSKK